MPRITPGPTLSVRGVADLQEKLTGKRPALPLLYLHGLSSLDFTPALEQFLGSVAGLSAATVTRLTTQWQDEAKAFEKRNLSKIDFVYLRGSMGSISRFGSSRKSCACW